MTELAPGGLTEFPLIKEEGQDLEVPTGDGPYMQMVYYAVVGFLFNTLVVTQLPLISEYYGGSTVLFYILFFYGGTSNIIRVYLLWHYSRFPASTAERLSKLIHVGSIFTALTLFLYPISMTLLGKSKGDTGFWICLGLAALAGISNSLLINAGFTFMSLAPRKSAHFFLLGQGALQVVSWPLLMILHIIVDKLGGGQDTNYIVAMLTLCAAGVVTLGAIPLYRCQTRHHAVFAPVLLDYTINQTNLDGSEPSQFRILLAVFRKIMIPATCGWIATLFTFMMYPSQISAWFPHDGSAAPYRTDQYQSFMIYIFAVADTIGRFVSKFISPTSLLSGPKFFALTCIRGIVLCPLILLSSMKIPEVLTIDWVRLILIIAFGFSFGINYSLATMMAPGKVESKDRMTVGTILSFVIINACFIGAMIGIGLKHAVMD
jgi:hypothetical protein